ncbi:hypothetical protein VYU27_001855 [Nannochloropsis oceanica]
MRIPSVAAAATAAATALLVLGLSSTRHVGVAASSRRRNSGQAAFILRVARAGLQCSSSPSISTNRDASLPSITTTTIKSSSRGSSGSRKESASRTILWVAGKKATGDNDSPSDDKPKVKSRMKKGAKEEKKEEDLEEFLAGLNVEGAERGGRERSTGEGYAYDEDDLTDDVRAMLAAPPKELGELLKDAGIEFGDPTLMVDDDGPLGFRAGFVSIVGSPNVGKSTLMNSLVGERVSIVTSKQQTTRHQIMGVVTGGDFQIVYYDTPGVLRPNYKLQEGMMAFVRESLGDADVVLLMTDVFENPSEWPDQEIFEQMQRSVRPLLLAVNKIDLLPNATHPQGNLGKDALAKIGNLEDVIGRWQAVLPNADIIPISAHERLNLDGLLHKIKQDLPLSPPLYPNDTLTDKPQRFFASEIIREKVFTGYSKEIPYSCEVAVTAFKDQGRMIKINSTIFTTRDSHVPILIGTKGNKLKEVGTLARLDLEEFFGKKVYLEMRVKVRKDWRTNMKDLSAFGYMQQSGDAGKEVGGNRQK